LSALRARRTRNGRAGCASTGAIAAVRVGGAGTRPVVASASAAAVAVSGARRRAAGPDRCARTLIRSVRTVDARPAWLRTLADGAWRGSVARRRVAAVGVREALIRVAYEGIGGNVEVAVDDATALVRGSSSPGGVEGEEVRVCRKERVFAVR